MGSNYSRVRKTITRMLAATALCVAPLAASATGTVVLKSADGSINMSGEFVDYIDDHYILRTALGDLRINAARVRCEGASCPSFDTEAAGIVITGSDTVGLGLMPLLMSGYASFLDAEAATKATQQDGEFLIDLIGDGGFGDPIGSVLVSSATSGSGFEDLLAGNSAIGMSSRRIKPAEARALKADGAGNMVSPDQEHIVAVDSLVIITHPSNPISQISTEQLQGIYSGRITNWNQIGGEDAPITAIHRQEGSGTRAVFEAGIFGDNVPPSANLAIAADNNEMASLVNNDPNAIGFVGYAFQRGAKALSLLNECGMLTEPDAFSAKVEEYALQRRLYLYNRADTTTPEVTELLNFAKSEEADGVIAKAGFIDLGISRKAQSMDGARARTLLSAEADQFEGGVIREMLATMIDYDRLSTTFRFRTGSSKLDERARLDMARLADFLAEQDEGTKVIFVGFTDDVGPFESNRELSVNRSQQVVEELYSFAGGRLGGIDISAQGYGEIASSACNTTDRGRAVNRRVEVWIQSGQQG